MNRKYYEETNYSDVNYMRVLGQFTNLYHKKLEKHWEQSYIDEAFILEVGGREGKHIKYAKANFKKYYCIDLDFKNKKKNTHKNLIF